MTRAPGDDALRTALAETWCGAAPGPDCPPDERLRAAASGELERQSFTATLDHVAGCPACQRVWAFAVALAATDDSAARAAAAPRRRVLVPGALAAALALVAVGAALVFLPRDGREVSATRSAPPVLIESLVPTEAPLARDACLLRWTPLEGDPRYELRVTTPDLEPVVTARDLPSPQHLVPAEALQGLPAGTTLLWRVEGRLPDGHRVRSRTFRVSVE